MQILYSYLLVEKKFTLEGPLTSPTREKRYAYGLYLDILVLIVMISERISVRGGDRPLERTRFVERIKEDDRIRGLISRYGREGSPFAGVVDMLAAQVKESGAYKGFLKDADNDERNSEEALWNTIFNVIIMGNAAVKEYCRKMDGYTLKGLERMQQMMNETLTSFITSQDTLAEGLKSLETSLGMARDLYMRLLALAVDLTDMRERQLDSNRYKHLRTQEDMNPNLKFVENEAIDVLRNDPRLTDYIEKNKISWANEDPLLMNTLMKAILESETYKTYMDEPDRSIKKDADLWKDLFRKVILVNSNFLEALEEKSVFWNDDVDVISDFVAKTFRRISDGISLPLLDKYKDEEDSKFGAELMKAVFKGREQYREWINNAVKGSQWEAERLAFMDVVVMITALAEIMNFPKIPLNVSINEYVEIAKSYSSARSGTFIHGVLGHILSHLKEEGQLYK